MNKTLVCLLVSVSGFASAANQPGEQANKLAAQNILIDTHIDVPYRVNNHWEDVTKATESGDFDYPRAVKGGLNSAFMSIYIPASYEQTGGGDALADKLIDSVEAIVGRAPEKFTLAYSSSDAERAFVEGKIALPMGMENGTPVEGSLEKLAHFYDRGIRYITLAHSMSNHIADSSYDLRRQWHGLSPFGKELVPEMNRLGIMVDISHVSDDAFYQAVEISKAPVIASHSSLRSFTPGFERNMDDNMIKALAKNGGVIQINFGSSFISDVAQQWGKKRKNELEKEKIAKDDKAAQKAFSERFKSSNPFPYASLDMVLDHIDHVKNLVGIDYVGIGSDFDGVGDSLPRDLKDVSYYPWLVQGLLDRGYSEMDIKKIMGLNLLRVWKQVEQVSASMNKA
ncbi:dipeptidase [Neptunicella marina]|uniref:Membrane dipeptidase n=1 Tax=Neptunicella marina TaxID=2125989 RepID=A0A8J6IT74_9ALTE|nr:dipeptidase [Neptunicella marina]MBC3765375.1 membrane dipeptidase [Neptunicella marina]